MKFQAQTDFDVNFEIINLKLCSAFPIFRKIVI